MKQKQKLGAALEKELLISFSTNTFHDNSGIFNNHHDFASQFLVALEHLYRLFLSDPNSRSQAVELQDGISTAGEIAVSSQSI